MLKAGAMIVRPVRESDAAAWERMRQELWPSPQGEHAAEIERFFKGDTAAALEVLVAVEESGQIVGFAEFSLRSYAEGCESDRVAYLEGWFVEASSRRKGVGAALIKAAEEWARSQGCTEFASDTEMNNMLGFIAHKSLGFEETARIICFRKSL